MSFGKYKLRPTNMPTAKAAAIKIKHKKQHNIPISTLLFFRFSSG